MQPYFFPYIGYFQLIGAVDTFVFYDDVNFIKAGWVNRNYIWGNGNKVLLTLQLLGASQNLLINQIEIGSNQNKLLKTIHHTYRKAPHFFNVFPVLEEIFLSDEKNLSKFLMHSIRSISDYLNITPEWIVSSEIEKNNALNGQAKILDICEKLNAKHYINAINGKSLYQAESFKDRQLKLSFIASQASNYPQYHKQFLPNLSVIDLLMFNSKSECSARLKEFVLE